MYKIYVWIVMSDRFFTGILSKSDVLSILDLEVESMHESAIEVIRMYRFIVNAILIL